MCIGHGCGCGKEYCPYCDVDVDTVHNGDDVQVSVDPNPVDSHMKGSVHGSNSELEDSGGC